MNHYITTYRKDYTWPHVSVLRPQPTAAKDAPCCTCIDTQQIFKELLDLTGMSCDRSSVRRQTKPESCLAKTKSISKIEVVRFDQPRICSKQVEKTCSDPYKSLKRIFPDDLMDAELIWKTTYQKDYSDPAARMALRERIPTIAEMDDERLRCSVPFKITIEADYQPDCRTQPSRYNENMDPFKKCDSKRKKTGAKCRKRSDDAEGRQTRLPPWKSEYQDSIDKIGQTILKVDLHRVKKKTVPVLAISH